VEVEEPDCGRSAAASRDRARRRIATSAPATTTATAMTIHATGELPPEPPDPGVDTTVPVVATS
jgi:hypothetical protein